MNNLGLTLRAIEPKDIDFLFAIENDVRLWHVSNTIVPFSRQLLEEYIAQAHQDIFTAKQQRFVLTNTSNTALGLIDLYAFEPFHRRAGVGLVIADTHRGKGYGKIALALVEEFAFSRLQLHQLYAGVSEDHKESIALFEGSGYQRTAVKLDWNYYNNTYHNEVVFQKIAHVST
ncbi:MAG: GNAT family N-acetyltransferase [Flavobacteriaceae bacterium]